MTLSKHHGQIIKDTLFDNISFPLQAFVALISPDIDGRDDYGSRPQIARTFHVRHKTGHHKRELNSENNPTPVCAHSEVFKTIQKIL